MTSQKKDSFKKNKTPHISFRSMIFHFLSSKMFSICKLKFQKREKKNKNPPTNKTRTTLATTSTSQTFRWTSTSCFSSVQSLRRVPGAGGRHSTHGKGHEEGGSAYAKVGPSLRSPPGYSRASTPKKPESAYFIALCSHLWLYWGLSPTTISLSLSKS